MKRKKKKRKKTHPFLLLSSPPIHQRPRGSTSPRPRGTRCLEGGRRGRQRAAKAKEEERFFPAVAASSRCRRRCTLAPRSRPKPKQRRGTSRRPTTLLVARSITSSSPLSSSPSRSPGTEEATGKQGDPVSLRSFGGAEAKAKKAPPRPLLPPRRWPRRCALPASPLGGEASASSRSEGSKPRGCGSSPGWGLRPRRCSAPSGAERTPWRPGQRF